MSTSVRTAVRIPVRIRGTGSALPSWRRTTEEVAAEAAPQRDPEDIARRTGIDARHWVRPDEATAPLAAEAMRAAIGAAGIEPGEIRRLIFATSTGGDFLSPATASAVAHELGLDDSLDAFDVCNGCATFLSALDLGARSVATGAGPVGVVCVETTSRYLRKDRPRPYLIFGDAAGAVVLDEARAGEGIEAIHLRNRTRSHRAVRIEQAWQHGEMPFIDFEASNDELTESALDCMVGSSRAVAQAAGIEVSDIEWFLPHQPNGVMFRKVCEALGAPAERIVPVVESIGSVGAAAVPFSLDKLMRTRDVRPGDRILMTAVGAGTAYGAAIYRVGGE